MFRVILLQAAATLVAMLAGGFLAGMRGGVSATLGGLACMLPNLLFALRLLPVAGRLGEWLWLGRSMAGCGLLLALLSLVCRASHWLLYYPVLVSLLLLLLFAATWWKILGLM